MTIRFAFEVEHNPRIRLISTHPNITPISICSFLSRAATPITTTGCDIPDTVVDDVPVTFRSERVEYSVKRLV